MVGKRTTGLALAATGVVFGDIGTSPLYTIRDCFTGPSSAANATPFQVLGVMSMVFWAIVIVVAIKYVLFVMRADNRGEGGILALMSLAMRGIDNPRLVHALTLLGLGGTALFYGDGMITPAISVLSALEGLEVTAPLLAPYIVPLGMGVLIGLFLLQSQGTHRVGTLFGPIMVVWFVVLAVLGAMGIARHPSVLQAALPQYAIAFFAADPARAFLTLGGVVLAITGAEALYADMGHFGRVPVRLAWIVLVFPSLLLNYFGQTALLLDDPAGIANPFFLLAPDWATIPLVLLSTAATIIASQAVISGAFSLTRQAMQLGFSPRMFVLQTSEREMGQVFIPRVNWVLLVSVLGLVLGFESSTALAAAYGIAVTGTMLVTTLMILVVARRLWRAPLWAVVIVGGAFLAVDLSFFAANLLKVPDGGWFPLAVGAALLLLMTTWKTGKELVARHLREQSLPLPMFIDRLTVKPITRVAGTAVFLVRNPVAVPTALLHNLKHNKVLHERVVLVTVRFLGVPRLSEEERGHVRVMGEGFVRVTLLFGFMERPDVPAALAHCALPGFQLDMMETSFFISRETVIPTAAPGMALWREKLFATMARNAASAPDFFNIPANRVIELGTQVQI